MLWTLHGYVFRELGRVFLVTLIVVSVVFTLIGLVQPLRQAGLVSAQKLFEVFLLTFPAVLSVTLPFAALFGATMAYGRLSEDNELEAARASGVSMVTLAMPAVVLAIGAGIACFLLSNFVVGWAVERASDFARSGFVDAAVNQLQRRGRLQMGRDITVTVEGFRYDPLKREGSVQGIMAVQRRRGANGEDQSIITIAETGTLVFLEKEHRAVVSLGDPAVREAIEAGRDLSATRRDIVTIEPRGQRMQVIRIGMFKRSFSFPAIRARNIKHMSLPELAGVLARPYEHPRVGDPLNEIRRKMAAREAMDRIAARLLPAESDLEDSPVAPLSIRLGPLSEASRKRGIWYRLTAERVEMPRGDYLLRSVEITRYQGEAPATGAQPGSAPPERYWSKFGVLTAEAYERDKTADGGPPKMDVRFALTLLEYRREVPDPHNPGQRIWQWETRSDGRPVRLELDDLVLLDERGDPAAESALVNHAGQAALFEAVLDPRTAGAVVGVPAGTLRSLVDEEVYRDARKLDAIQRLFRHKVHGEINTRVAFAYCTVVFVLLGAAVGTVFKGGTPLKAFLISFLPWVAAMLLITFGKRLAEGAVDSPAAGLTVIWLTAGAMTVATLAVFVWLLKR